jgi:hypothetical protein
MHVTLRSPRIYKRGGRGTTTTTRTRKTDRRQICRLFDSSEANTHTLSTHVLRPRSSSLSHPLVTPNTSTSVQDNTRPPSPTGRRAFFSPNQYKIVCGLLAHHPDPRRADTHYSLVLKPLFLTPTGSDRELFVVSNVNLYKLINGSF